MPNHYMNFLVKDCCRATVTSQEECTLREKEFEELNLLVVASALILFCYTLVTFLVYEK